MTAYNTRSSYQSVPQKHILCSARSGTIGVADTSPYVKPGTEGGTGRAASASQEPGDDPGAPMEEADEDFEGIRDIGKNIEFGRYRILMPGTDTTPTRHHK